MRKVLLGGAAMLGAAAGFAGAAFAQTTLPPVYTQGVPSAPSPVQGANNSNNYQAASLPGGIANPVPGSVVVRFNGRFVAYGYDEGNTFDRTKNLGPATGANTSGTPAKDQNFGVLGFFRLYTGVDGLAANGLKYGASVEVRTDEGPTPGSTSNDGASAGSRSNTLYIRRAFGYLGADQLGIVRYGQGDGINGIFDNGVTTFQNFDDGGWNGDVPGALPGNAQVTFPFLSQDGVDYDPAKIVYLSPQVEGFDFGVHYAPSTATLQSDANVNIGSLTSPGNATLNAQTCAVAASGCPNLASSSVASDAARFKNWYAAGVRYQNRIGDVAVYGYAAYDGSGHVNYTGPAPGNGNQFNGFSFGDGGGAITYAGFTIGGHYMYGDFNGSAGLQPKHGARGEVWLGGIQYAFGPLTMGASYYDFTSQGSPSLVRLSQRHETGTAAGLTYSVAPGLSVFTSYLYGTRHQGDFNFQTSAAGTSESINSASGHAYNSIQAQAIAVGTIVKW